MYIEEMNNVHCSDELCSNLRRSLFVEMNYVDCRDELC